jgi:hypothetical protein
LRVSIRCAKKEGALLFIPIPPGPEPGNKSRGQLGLLQELAPRRVLEGLTRLRSALSNLEAELAVTAEDKEVVSAGTRTNDVGERLSRLCSYVHCAG